MPRKIAIVGAGYSGTLLALHLLEGDCDAFDVALFERSPSFARGLAYATHNPRHLLNVRVSNMSAWADDPRHLQAWLAQSGSRCGGSDFISRETYGHYLASMLQHAVARASGPQRLLLEHDEVVAAERAGPRLRLTLAMGRTVDVDVLVLAAGNQPPSSPEGLGLDSLPPDRYVANPWAEAALEGLDPDAPVLTLGAGLTMVDVALALEGLGRRGPLIALSRRGVTPRRHEGEMVLGPSDLAIGDLPLSRQLQRVRQRSRDAGWRRAMDELRPVTQAIWRAADPAKRRRFLRHLRPWWDAHRHRMAPVVADWFDAQVAAGRLQAFAGRLTAVQQTDRGVAVTWRPRGSRELRTIEVARIINCSGAGADLARTPDKLLRNLLDAGMARADPLGLGLDVDEECGVIDANGRRSAEIYAVGPLTRGAFWEIIAVPDIRNQVAELAGRLRRRLSARAQRSSA
jgi:uncharacterized NAD(P)/FAD-binding protein YdhS